MYLGPKLSGKCECDEVPYTKEIFQGLLCRGSNPLYQNKWDNPYPILTSSTLREFNQNIATHE